MGDTLNRGPVYKRLNIWHVKESEETSRIGEYVCICILHYPPKYKMTNNTLIEDSPKWATGVEYKYTQIHTHIFNMFK
jgi:hypothetical protein